MTPTRQGSFKLFSLARISVYLHWSWFLVAAYSIQYRTREYSSMFWNALEYVSLFLIVLLHEFGHQLACRQVGGRTHDIVLWPLGGVAYVSPPERPGAQLWSVVAGPLVNVLLVPVFFGLVLVGGSIGWWDPHSDGQRFLRNVFEMNLALLIFNLMPVYPLDGGQILRSLLWFVVGRANSLLAASGIGFIGVAGLLGLAIWGQSIWIGIMACFVLLSCWRGLSHARVLARLAKLPRREGVACPSCNSPPPIGPIWRCAKCGNGFDTFQTAAVCPGCGTQYHTTQCLDCGTARPMSEWITPPPIQTGTGNA